MKNIYQTIKWVLILWIVQHFLRFGFDSLIADVVLLAFVPFLIIGAIIAPFMIFIVSLFTRH